jgi:hypothetical protein
MTFQKRLPIYIGLFLLTLLFGWLNIPQADYLPHGIFLPGASYQSFAGKTTAVDPSLVYTMDLAHSAGVFLGTLNVETAIKDGDVATAENETLAYMKAVTGAQGANRLGIMTAFETPDASMLIVQAKVYFV